jgi:hypothetical protein
MSGGPGTNDSSPVPTVGSTIVVGHVSTTTVGKSHRTSPVRHKIVWCPPVMEGYQSIDAVTVAD